MMCPEDGISTTTPSTPHSLALWMSSTMQRANANISGPRSASTIDFTAASSWGDTIGIPASMRSTPAAESRLAIANLSSARERDPRLLLAVAKRNIVESNPRRELEPGARFVEMVPGAREEAAFGLPRRVGCHPRLLI